MVPLQLFLYNLRNIQPIIRYTEVIGIEIDQCPKADSCFTKTLFHVRTEKFDFLKSRIIKKIKNCLVGITIKNLETLEIS